MNYILQFNYKAIKNNCQIFGLLVKSMKLEAKN